MLRIFRRRKRILEESVRGWLLRMGLFGKRALVEVMCEQIRLCFFNLEGLISYEDYHFLELSVEHLDLLLDTLSSKINIEEYLKRCHSLFSLAEEYSFTCDHLSQLSTLEKRKENYIHVSDEIQCFIEILRICSEHIKKHLINGNYEAVKNEIYYNHNVPSLIATYKKDVHKDLIKYYLDIECTGFKKSCSKEIVQPYECMWVKIRAQYSHSQGDG